MRLPAGRTFNQRRWCTKCRQMVTINETHSAIIGTFDELGEFDAYKLSCPVCDNGIAVQLVEFEEEVAGTSVSSRVSDPGFMLILRGMNQ